MGTIKSLKRKRINENGRLGKGKFKDPPKINPNCRLEWAWVWPKQVSDLVEKYIGGYSLNICAGLSNLGNVRIDLEPRDKSTGMADMNSLPYTDNTFDTVISDPPWKIGFFQRMKPFFEAVRVCKVGGIIIYNCTWKPTSKFVKLEKVFLRSDNHWANISAIYIFKKIKNID